MKEQTDRTREVIEDRLKRTEFITDGFRDALIHALSIISEHEGMKKEIVRLKAEKKHLCGIKFVPHMQSWEDLTAERDSLKAELQRLKKDKMMSDFGYAKIQELRKELKALKITHTLYKESG